MRPETSAVEGKQYDSHTGSAGPGRILKPPSCCTMISYLRIALPTFSHILSTLNFAMLSTNWYILRYAGTQVGHTSDNLPYSNPTPHLLKYSLPFHPISLISKIHEALPKNPCPHPLIHTPNLYQSLYSSRGSLINFAQQGHQRILHPKEPPCQSKLRLIYSLYLANFQQRAT